MKPFAHFPNEIGMVLGSTEAAVKPLIASQQSPGGCREAIYKLFKLNIDGFGISRKLL